MIGSAAVALHGAAVAVDHDVDVLIDARDMPSLAARTGMRPEPGVANDRFHSEHVLQLNDLPLPLDLFADLRVRTGGKWRRLRPRIRLPVSAGDTTVFVPAVAELIDILTLLNREKDLARATLLRGSNA